MPTRRQAIIWINDSKYIDAYIEGILPKGPYPPCLRMADRALLAGYPRYMHYSAWMSQWCQAVSHYLNQCWLKSWMHWCITWVQCVNSLAHARLANDFKSITYKLIIHVTQDSSLGARCEIALRWMPQNLFNESALVQIAARCHKATNHYLSQ